jgi:hypothetical protein
LILANNGYLLNNVCAMPSEYSKALAQSYSACIKTDPNYIVGQYFASTYSFVSCQGNFGWVKVGDLPQYNCDVAGPSLTEQQQIEAINGLFPYVVAIIAAAWACRFLIGLVNQWLKETRSSDHD